MQREYDFFEKLQKTPRAASPRSFNLGLDEFPGAKMSMRQTFSEFIPKKFWEKILRFGQDRGSKFSDQQL
jgi:hypothetical protein